MKPHTGPKAIPKIITGRQDAGVTEPPIGISKSLTCDRMKLSARHTPPDVILRIFSLLLDIYTSIQNSVCRRIQTEEKNNKQLSLRRHYPSGSAGRLKALSAAVCSSPYFCLST